jgi:hypothetical protein
MTRQLLRVAVPIFFVFTVACGPEPIRPRAVLEPPRDPAPADAHPSPPPETSDAVAPVSDAAPQRPKLPAPEAGTVTTPSDGAADMAVIDAVVDAGVDAVLDTSSARRPVAGDIEIVEVLVNPAGEDAGREWIEIVSRAVEPLDLSQLHVADMSIDVAAPAGVIDPGSRIVLGQLVDTSKNGGAPVAVAYGTRLTLNNDGEEISICVGACAGGEVIARASWKTLGAAYDGHALVFDRGANRMCAAAAPFGTAGDFGTPGEPDSGCLAPDGGL